MRVSYEWLCDLAGIRDLTPQQAAEILTMAGWNVEEVIPVDLSALRVGRVTSQEPHPGSRKPLWVHQVDLGDHRRQIVAGAPNAVSGSLVAVALPGTTVIANADDPMTVWAAQRASGPVTWVSAVMTPPPLRRRRRLARPRRATAPRA